MAALTVQSIDPFGTLATYVSASAGGDTIADDGSERIFLHVKNGGGSAMVVTAVAQKTSISIAGVGSLSITSKAVTVSAGTEKYIGPFTDAFRDTTGAVSLTYSDVTSVTVAAVKLPKQTP